MASTRKLKELVKLVQKTYRLTYEDACIKMEKEADNKMRLQLAIAECYEDLNQSKEYLALYQQISNSGPNPMRLIMA